VLTDGSIASVVENSPVPGTLPVRTEGHAAAATPPWPTPPIALRPLGRPLKRWRYAGVYGDELMVCAASVRIGGAPQWFWAVWDRAARRLVETTRFVPGGVGLASGVLRVRGRRTRVDLALAPAGPPVATLSRHGAGWIWTRKLPVRARGTVLAGGRAHEVDARGLIDDSAGYHARVTAWSWSAGVGATPAGEEVWWNLVTGVHDAPAASERSVWVGDDVREPGPVAFAEDLSAVRGDDGSILRFTAEAERQRHDDLGLFRSDYRQPFGAFAGILPGGVRLAHGAGVMERHDVRW
jgi:hypothetical protein